MRTSIQKQSEFVHGSGAGRFLLQWVEGESLCREDFRSVNFGELQEVECSDPEPRPVRLDPALFSCVILLEKVRLPRFLPLLSATRRIQLCALVTPLDGHGDSLLEMKLGDDMIRLHCVVLDIVAADFSMRTRLVNPRIATIRIHYIPTAITILTSLSFRLCT